MAHKVGASLMPNPDISLVDAPGAAALRLDDVKLTEALIDLEDDLKTLETLF